MINNIRPFLPSWKQWDQFLVPIHDPHQPKTFVNNGRVCFNHLQLAKLINQDPQMLFAIISMKNNTYHTHLTNQKTTPMAWATTAMLDGFDIAQLLSNALRNNYVIHKRPVKWSGKLYFINKDIKQFVNKAYSQDKYFLKSPWAKTQQGTYITGFGNIQNLINKILTIEMLQHPHTIKLNEINDTHTVTPEVHDYIKQYYPQPSRKIIFNGRDAS